MSGGGVPIKERDDSGEWIDVTERHNIECLSANTLREALRELGLPVPKKKREMALLLVGAGLNATQVECRYGWRARLANADDEASR